MAIFQLLEFENNPQVMEFLQKSYEERRKIDKELGNKSTVRLLTATIAGSHSGTMYIQYEYDTLAQMEEEMNKRSANARWVELNDGLFAAGFKQTAHAVLFENTPQ